MERKIYRDPTPEQMTSYGLGILLKELDLRYQELVTIHKNPDFLNQDAPEYETAIRLFMQVQEDIFKLKDIMHTVTELEIEEK